MNGLKFERYIKRVFRKEGFSTSLCKKSGAQFHDEDLIIGDLALAQIKYTKKGKFTINSEILSRLYINSIYYILNPILIVGFKDISVYILTVSSVDNVSTRKSITFYEDGNISQNQITNFKLSIFTLEEYLEKIEKI